MDVRVVPQQRADHVRGPTLPVVLVRDADALELADPAPDDREVEVGAGRSDAKDPCTCSVQLRPRVLTGIGPLIGQSRGHGPAVAWDHYVRAGFPHVAPAPGHDGP